MPNDIPLFQFAVNPRIADLGVDFLPHKNHLDDVGWDLKCAEENGIVLRSGMYAKIDLGIRMFAPQNWWLELRPRSSTFAKKQLHALYGVVDSGYENNLCAVVQYLPDLNSLGNDLSLHFGEAIFQAVPVRRQEMQVELITNERYDQLCLERNGTRGTGGFGSTSK